MAAKPGNATKLLLVVLILVLAATAVIVLLSRGDPEAPSSDPKQPATPEKVEPPAHTNEAAGSSRVIATRAHATAAVDNEDLADRPSACLLVVDSATGTPIAGASVRRLHGGAEIAFTDERGLAALPLKHQEQLAVILDGYLLRMAPTQVGTTEADPKRVLLVRDAWSMVRRFEFAGPGGEVNEAFVRFRPQAAPGAKPTAIGPSGDDVVAQRAWTEHTMLAGQPVCADIAVQLGAWSQDRVHRIPNHGEVRFAAPGDFVVEVATESGLVGQTTIRLDPASSGGPSQTIPVQLRRGDFVAGTVAAADTAQPLRGAELTVQGGEPLGLVATSGDDGAFRLGPLLPGTVTLNVRHGDHEPLAKGPIAADATGVKILLQPLPKTTLRGRVLGRPDGLPLAGAVVAWLPSSGKPITASTNADGTFLLAATGDQPSRLTITAIGFVAYAELVEPGAPFLQFDLWPADADTRLAKGITARLVGIVVDAHGRPVPSVAVRWMPDHAIGAHGAPGRRVLYGGTLELPTTATTGDDGVFNLETAQFGSGRVCLAAAGRSAPGGAAAEAVAGRIKDGLRVQQ